jgi:hypothetical protein
MIAGVGVGRFADFWDASRAWALERITLVPDDVRAATYEDLYQRVYRPLCEVLSPFHHVVAELSDRAADGDSKSKTQTPSSS